MPNTTRIVAPDPELGVVLADGEPLTVPADWELLPPGDAGLTRRVKSGGPTWTVKEKVRRRVMSRGVWAPADRIAAARASLEAERATPAYARKRAADVRRRERAHQEYVAEFQRAVLDFLDFDPAHTELARSLSRVVAEHATPVGSGTVARTERIPIERRAEAATIAWMRHQTTAYDDMRLPRVKGLRRETRRRLAKRSRQLLDAYRRGQSPADCPLSAALDRAPEASAAAPPASEAAPSAPTPSAPTNSPTVAPAPATRAPSNPGVARAPQRSQPAMPRAKKARGAWAREP